MSLSTPSRARLTYAPRSVVGYHGCSQETPISKRFRDPEAPEVLEAILERMRSMTRDEWLQELAWRPEDVEETWRMARLPNNEGPEDAEAHPSEETQGDTAVSLGKTAAFRDR